MYDVIVVGARCAGAPAAMLLARKGYRVLLLERARFPADTVSTLYIHQPGVALLDRWGLREPLAATGCPPINSALHQVGDIRIEGWGLPVAGIDVAYAPRRTVLDPLLADAAASAGATFRDGCSVSGLVTEHGRVAGVRLGRDATVVRAPLVVGADGMRSLVAAAACAPTVLEQPRKTCIYYGFWAGVPARFEAYGAAGRWVCCAPTHDGRTLVGVYFPQDEFPQIRGRAERAYREAIAATAPDLHRRLLSGRQVGKLYGHGTQRNFFRQPTGPGWVLLGDAAHHKDSISGDGITDAFCQAQLLADSLDGLGPRGLADPAALDAALHRYAVAQQSLLLPRFQATMVSTRLAPHRRLGALAMIAADPVRTTRYFTGVAGVDHAIESLVNPLSPSDSDVLATVGKEVPT
ncbi:NAD(P)/FAD-dependent oxidoreductase [Nocardia altamirensis]|uniref:NAD(P)/FAD-dependent oxidoreductase n=1 Tax=Nocardia altamirensis TaxID=472158 RepID=UPI0008406A0C|nr:NAD(P)/FAD-dependent oxidoreductase [Nocardia altamirensis]